MRRLIHAFAALLIVGGAGILIYFVAADVWNNYQQSKVIIEYQEKTGDLTEEDYNILWEQAEAYNAGLSGAYPYLDVFDGTEIDGTEAYQEALNVNGDGVIGYINIPKIDVSLAVYHGVSDEVLEIGVGHVSQTSLITGVDGESTVLAAHRGLTSARLFTDLDQLEEGDTFTLIILNKVFTYKVDMILDMVERTDYELMQTAFAAVPDKNYVSLLTCTPYGVNTHRLIVRGELINIEYVDETEEEIAPVISTTSSTVQFVAAMFGIIFIYIIVRLILGKVVSTRRQK